MAACEHSNTFLPVNEFYGMYRYLLYTNQHTDILACEICSTEEEKKLNAALLVYLIYSFTSSGKPEPLWYSSRGFEPCLMTERKRSGGQT